MCLTVKHICMADNGTGSVQFADDVIADKDRKGSFVQCTNLVPLKLNPLLQKQQDDTTKCGWIMSHDIL